MSVQAGHSLDTLVAATRSRARAKTVAALDSAARDVVEAVRDLKQYAVPLRHALGDADYESALQRRMGGVSARQIVLAFDGQYEKMNTVHYIAFSRALQALLVDYIMRKLDVS